MIESFGIMLAEDLFYDKASSATRRLPNEPRRIARLKLLYLNDAAELNDLRVPPGIGWRLQREILRDFMPSGSMINGGLSLIGMVVRQSTFR
jgi:hypothetical protein